ncbi:hypothetical protein [Amycolatopsis vancoresmycina]|uniref:acyl-CoA-like ligand-binding transcription factor n=1 Tax=Amycolatopsis vancoresmycina TaxID=208444 RepID=UPI00039E9C35|nr:hypothetical protein [Amycolatopsis vancoresmycina]
MSAFRELAGEFPAHAGRIRELARLTRSSPALDAWTARTYQRYERMISILLASRFDARPGHDPRPRLLAALAMAAVRVSLDEWVRDGGELPELIGGALAAVSVEGA